jgi:hypothetical protein
VIEDDECTSENSMETENEQPVSSNSDMDFSDDPIEIDLKSLEEEDDTLYFSLLLFSFAKRGHVSRDCYYIITNFMLVILTIFVKFEGRKFCCS